jgi:hypothetical protein
MRASSDYILNSYIVAKSIGEERNIGYKGQKASIKV